LEEYWMTLKDKQVLFTKCLGALLRYAGEQGYELTMGESHVMTPRKGEAEVKVLCSLCGNPTSSNWKGYFEDKVHMENSLHYSRLAVDLNLFIKGKYIEDGQHEAWANLGHFWEGLDPQCTWGGRFKDANHFSITHEGKK
jgi:hypothetical protein